MRKVILASLISIALTACGSGEYEITKSMTDVCVSRLSHPNITIKIVKVEVLETWESPLRGLDRSKGGYEFGLKYMATMSRSNGTVFQRTNTLHCHNK